MGKAKVLRLSFWLRFAELQAKSYLFSIDIIENQKDMSEMPKLSIGDWLYPDNPFMAAI